MNPLLHKTLTARFARQETQELLAHYGIVVGSVEDTVDAIRAVYGNLTVIEQTHLIETCVGVFQFNGFKQLLTQRE